jgi:hypothetical protein
LKPDNFRSNTSFESNNISFERRDSDLSKVITPASIAGLIVELQQIKEGTLNIANWSQAMIRLVWNPRTSVVIQVLQHTIYQ